MNSTLNPHEIPTSEGPSVSFKELLFFLPASSAERSWIKPLMRREALPRFPVGAALKCTFFHSLGAMKLEDILDIGGILDIH